MKNKVTLISKTRINQYLVKRVFRMSVPKEFLEATVQRIGSEVPQKTFVAGTYYTIQKATPKDNKAFQKKAWTLKQAALRRKVLALRKKERALNAARKLLTKSGFQVTKSKG